MTPIPLGLFQLLGTAAASVVRPTNSTRVEGVSFEELLELAKSGEIASGQGVEIQPDLGLELTNDQLARLSEAADRAMASGATDVIVTLDGMALRLDVQARRIVGVVDLDRQRELIGIDGFISASPVAEVNTPVAGPGVGTLPESPSLLQALSQIKRAG